MPGRYGALFEPQFRAGPVDHHRTHDRQTGTESVGDPSGGAESSPARAGEDFRSVTALRLGGLQRGRVDLGIGRTVDLKDTGKPALLPVVTEAGIMKIEPRALPALQYLEGDHKAVVDAKSGEVKASGDKPRRVR